MRLSFRTLQLGNAVRDALRRKEDAERPERHADAERRTIVAFDTRRVALRRTTVAVLRPAPPPPALPTTAENAAGRSRRPSAASGSL
ncbi:DUF1534 domain-containing protein [Pseudomonas syringae pv. maculicola str. ES4326]|uniref:DUF1534 domain-containing protein n=1 Tax=Pseudomonas syringae pv. maculicola str. ES4326 TaxID=629265 RepID=A0A8T8C993_PSEYM|nr:DUF1534 domain-containing protein [Pseudomonas syringae pv. maculicola str. ES4326]